MASERAAALADQDARCRRVEALLDVVLAMRELFNEQHAAHEREVPPWVPSPHSPEALARLALCRKLEGRAVPLDDQLDLSNWNLTTTYLWSSGQLETAIAETKRPLKVTVS
jgi:hypothetical protein